MKVSSKQCISQTVRARELKFFENVRCQVSCVTSYLLFLNLLKLKVKFFVLYFLSLFKKDKVLELVGGVYLINEAYPV